MCLHLYIQEFQNLVQNYANFENLPANPLLLKVPENYHKANVKVMIFGQETNGWDGNFQNNENIDQRVDQLRDLYNDFYNNNGWQDFANRPFWSFYNLITQLINGMYPNVKVEYLWNNIVKIGRAGEIGIPDDVILDWQTNWFEIINHEVNNLKPDIVIFLTGPYYDQFIRMAFPDAVFNVVPNVNLSQRRIASITATGLPKSSIRTYHPGFLYHGGNIRIQQYLQSIGNFIAQHQ